MLTKIADCYATNGEAANFGICIKIPIEDKAKQAGEIRGKPVRTFSK